MSNSGYWSRRTLLRVAAYTPAFGLPRFVEATVGTATGGATQPAERVTPFPLQAVRLHPSLYLTAVESNGAYLLRLEPDRLLHNFRVSAGLEPKGAVYGGWESESLAGHSLGHYLSACSLMFAQTAAGPYRERVEYIVTELTECQAAHTDGYVAGFTRKRGEVVEDGKKIFPEIAEGDIRALPFSLNGAWSPLYTLHKLFAGLLDAHDYRGSEPALKVAIGLGAYLEGVFAKLSEPQMQQMLACEYGGLNESFAQLYERTSDGRWLAIARRIYDHKVLDPLSRRKDELAGLHSNTQVPKVIGLARLHEATGDAGYATAAQFFWQTVTRNHSYVIGGNADRESFESPLSQYVTEQTCEACNTYNMLKLTRHLYQWQPDAAYFDYYERAHLNHILAQHDPQNGMFAYMMPLMSGARREFSTPFDDFWCCLGTGMESHSKHGDSIYWQRGDQLFVNLYIPSELTWKEQQATLAIRTDYPFAGDVVFEMTRLQQPRTFTVAFRIPAWCRKSSLKINGQAASGELQGGYLTVRRQWLAGDKVELQLAMRLRTEPIRDQPNLVALLRGPLVMAADLGPASEPFEGTAPVLVAATTADVLKSIRESSARQSPGTSLNTGSTSQPPNLSLRPFFSQYDRRSAVYFPQLTEEQWGVAQSVRMAERARQSLLDARTLDVMRFGDKQSERDHALQAGKSESVLYRGRNGRLARGASAFEFRLQCANKPVVLQATYWGKQRNSRFRILANGVRVAAESVDGSGPIAFVDRSYPIPAEVTQGKEFVAIRFEPDENASAGPVFECRLLPAMEQTLATDEVAPGIHFRRGVDEDATPANSGAIANIGFIIGREAVAVMDPGGSLVDGQRLRATIRKATNLPIRYVILSHVHPDHIFGAGAFVDDKPQFVGHALLPNALAQRGEYYRTRLNQLLGEGQAGPIVVPTLLVKDTSEIDLGGRILAITAHGTAHTDSDLSVLDRQTRTLLLSDLLFVKRVPSLDGSLKGWLAELAKLKALDVRRAVPGHGPTGVDWPSASRDLERYLVTLQKEIRAAIAKGVDIDQASRTVGLAERDRWTLFDDYNGHNVTRAYKELEWD